MRPSVFLVFCVLSCFCSKFVLCEVAGQEGTNLNSPQCLDIDMQVEKTSEDIQTVTEKIKRYYMDHEMLTPKEAFITTINLVHKIRHGILSDFTSEHLSKFLSLWPWNWMDSIEYIGYTWVIIYFSFTLIKFAMMDERQMLRMARLTGKNRH
ncbi:hypothetical protein ACROYT_G021313 [Oculina patagonica]